MSVAQRSGEDDDLGESLFCERKPASDLRVEVVLEIDTQRYVNERARWGDEQAVGADSISRVFEAFERGVEIGAPDVASVDDAQRECERRRGVGEGGVELAGLADQVEVESGDRQ